MIHDNINNMHERILLFTVLSVIFVSEYTVRGFNEFVILTNNGPVVQGAEITFTARVYASNGQDATGHFEFSWEDNGIPYHSRTVKTDNSEDKWNVRYEADHYPPGPYTMQVEVYTCIIFCFPLTSNRIHFNITAKLNGQMSLIQNNNLINNDYVSNTSKIEHVINLSPPDHDYLVQNATSLLTYWFIDCQYYGMTTGFNYSYKYGQVESKHVVEALIVAGFEPVPTPTPPPTVPPHNNNETNKVKRDLNIYATNGSMITIDDQMNTTLPFVCLNQTNIAPDAKKAYGYFARTMTVKAPVSNITTKGNTWLQHGEMLSLDIRCTGSSSFKYCVNFMSGIHNTTGNETCASPPVDEQDDCVFNIARYYKSFGEYTVLVIISNPVSKLVYPIGINVYKVEKRAQLSVIVVPVLFSLVAVVLIVFGVAWYVQNQRRFTVEVANFDFGQSYTDLEYKTFRERLRESVTNALTRAPHADQSEVEESGRGAGRKYGSMT